MPIMFTCPHCGRQTNVPDAYVGQSGPCAGCGGTITIPRSANAGPFAPGPVRPPSIGDDPTMRMLLPVGRSGLAIAAGYAGLLSLMPLFAPIAIILGGLAIWDIRTHPGKRGMGRAIFGLVMGIVMICVLIVLIIAASVN
jgi:hypothetical protein